MGIFCWVYFKQKLISGLKYSTCTHSVGIFNYSNIHEVPCMVTLAQELHRFSWRAPWQCLSHLIDLLVFIHFQKLVLIKLNVRWLLTEEIYGSYRFQPTYEILLSVHKISQLAV